MLEKAIDGLGKTSVVTIPVSEAMHRVGVPVDPYWFQFAAAAAAVALVADKIIRLYWEQKDRRKNSK